MNEIELKLEKKGHSDPAEGVKNIESAIQESNHPIFKDREFQRILIQDIKDLHEWVIDIADDAFDSEDRISILKRAKIKATVLRATATVRMGRNPYGAITSFLSSVEDITDTGDTWGEDFPEAFRYMHDKYNIMPREIGLE